MKRVFLAGLLLLTVLSANAHEWHHEYRERCCYRGGIYYGGNNWVAPALIGGVIGYELSRPRTEVIVEQQPIVVQQPQTFIQAPPVGYHWQQMIDPQTNTIKIVLVPN